MLKLILARKGSSLFGVGCVRATGAMPAELDPLARRRCRPTGGVATTSSFMFLVSFDRTVLVLVLVLVLKPRPVYAWLRCRSLPNWASDGYRMRAKIRCACVIMGGPPGRRTPMNENELFQAALGLLPPWLVSRCTFEESAGRLDIHLDFPRGSVFPCPVCGVPCKAYDTDDLTWRHLNFFQHQAFLHARPSRVECSRCGIHRVAVPWARADSSFTLLFEALVVMLAKSMPVLAVAHPPGACPRAKSRHQLPLVFRGVGGDAPKSHPSPRGAPPRQRARHP